jgi:hypothetical protein
MAQGFVVIVAKLPDKLCDEFGLASLAERQPHPSVGQIPSTTMVWIARLLYIDISCLRLGNRTNPENMFST